MDYKEKFEDFLDRMTGLLDEANKKGHIIVRVEDLENAFPELKESEDEKVRKAIHIYLDWLDGRKDCAPKGRYSIKDMIAWLEKQGELKPILDIEIPFGAKDSELIESTYFIPKGFHAEIIGDEVHIKQGEQKTFDTDTIKKKAHQIAWEISKHYDPNACKKEWCEMAAIDMASWLKKQSEKPQGKSALEAIKEEKTDNANKVKLKDYSSIDPHFFKTVDNVEPFDKYEGLTDFERALADICIGWIGGEIGWKQYIKDNADILLKIAIEKFNSVQDVPFEQNPANKAKPKFKNGQWIVWQDKCYQVYYNGCGYELIDQNGLSTSLEYDTIDENARLWTIQDAKNGDVLAFDNIIVMFKDLYKTTFHSYCYIEHEAFCISKDNISDWWICQGFHPATKEQRALLFQKMKEAGYEWDVDKKELKKVEE